MRKCIDMSYMYCKQVGRFRNISILRHIFKIWSSKIKRLISSNSPIQYVILCHMSCLTETLCHLKSLSMSSSLNDFEYRHLKSINILLLDLGFVSCFPLNTKKTVKSYYSKRRFTCSLVICLKFMVLQSVTNLQWKSQSWQ